MVIEGCWLLIISVSEISEDEKRLVESQLEIILASTYFNSAKQMQRFLEYIVEKTLAGQGNLLKQYTIGVEALDLPDDFDSDSNPIVRIMGGRVRNRLKEFYHNTSNNIVITIPKGHYTAEFNRHSENTETIKTKPYIEKEEIEASSGPKIALVSFSDVTQSTASNRLLLRATDCLAKELSSFVLSKFIIFNPYSDKSESTSAYQEIDADYRLYLYMQELSSGKYEFLCRLTDANEEIVWSEIIVVSSEVPLIDQENILSRIITVIADIHQGKLYLDWARKLLLNKDNIPDKFKACAYYRQFYDDLSEETFTKAVEVCEKGLERNPNDVIANILLSDLCRLDYIYRYNLIDSSLDKGVLYAEKAIHLSPESHRAHFALGRILFSQGDWDRSLDELFHARSMCRFNASIEYGCGFYLCAIDRWDEGLPMVKRAMGMSTNYPSWYRMIISLDYYIKGNYQEAITEAEKIVAPGIAHGPMARCIAYAKLGDIANAKNELKELASRIPKLEKNGKSTLTRFFGNEKLAEQIWEGVEIAIKG